MAMNIDKSMELFLYVTVKSSNSPKNLEIKGGRKLNIRLKGMRKPTIRTARTCQKQSTEDMLESQRQLRKGNGRNPALRPLPSLT